MSYDPDFDYVAGAEALARQNEALKAENEALKAQAQGRPRTPEEEAELVSRMRTAKSPEHLREILDGAGLLYEDD